MATGALRLHQHWLVQSPPDLPQEAAEHIKSLLPLQLPHVDIEIDFIVGMETEDRQDISSRPDPQIRALGVGRTRQHDLRPRYRKHCLSFGVLALPAPLRDEIENSLPILHRDTRDTQVRQ